MIDFAYLQHGTLPGPFRTECVKVRHDFADRWSVWFEGRWRRVHIAMKRCFIVFQGQRITVQIEGV